MSQHFYFGNNISFLHFVTWIFFLSWTNLY